MRGRGEWDEDVVDRTKASGTTDPLALELMQEVVYLRGELAKCMRRITAYMLAETTHRRRDD